LDIDHPGGNVPWGAAGQNKTTSISIVYSGGDAAAGDRVALYVPHSNTAIHEFGHNMGKVGEQSPNYKQTDEDGDKNHSKHPKFPSEHASYKDVRAFNVPGHYSLEALPRSVMSGRTDDYRTDEGAFFHEEFEYNKLLNADHRFGTSPDPCPMIGCSPPFCSDIYMVLHLEEDLAGDRSVEVTQSYVVHEKPYTELDLASPYALVCMDEASQVIAWDPFNVSFDTRYDIPDNGDRGKSTQVSLTRPLPDGTTSAQIWYNDQVLATLNKSENLPVIGNILSPEPGRQIGPSELVEIEWEASDPDGDPLHYSVSYSPNPSDEPEKIRWLPIAIGTTETSVQWMTGGFPGTDGGRIRIMASDGFYPAVKESGDFSVAGKPPMVAILQPSKEQVFLEHDQILLEAMALDLEGGMLDGDQMQWNIDNRSIGNGRRVLVESGTLQPNTGQSIHLTVTDGTNQINKSVEISILGDGDEDGISDEYENHYETQDHENPYDAGVDTDEDGLTSLEEFHFNTSPENQDTDGDGHSDSEEVQAGSDPNDPESLPPKPELQDYSFAISAHIGWGVPLFNFRSQVTNGLIYEMDLEYRFSRLLAVNATLGSYRFNPDFRIRGITMYLKGYRQVSASSEIYGALGAGIYKPQNLNLAFGVSPGIGLSRALSQRFRGEISAHYFHLFSEGDDIDYIILKAGVVFTF